MVGRNLNPERKMNVFKLLTPFLSGVLFTVPALAYTIDGNLADWGVSHNGNAGDWTPNSGIHFTVEDQKDSFLLPGWGGQAYDAEAMYVTWDASNLYIAIATGHNPATPNNPTHNSFGAGDIAIDIGNNGSWDYGIDSTGNYGAAGSLYSNVSWGYGLWNAANAYDPAHPDPAHPTSIQSGTLVGAGALVSSGPGTGYGEFSSSHQHYFYEVAIPLSLFGGQWAGMDFKVHWTQNCANDAISVVAQDFPQNNVPEPGTLALLPLGALALGLLRRRSAQ